MGLFTIGLQHPFTDGTNDQEGLGEDLMRCVAVTLMKGMTSIRGIIAEHDKGGTRWLYDNQGIFGSFCFLNRRGNDQGHEFVCTKCYS